MPCILPVTFKVIGERILLRASPGTKLAATRNAVVAFEVDEFDAAGHTGWSVLVTGVASEGTDPDDEAAQRLQLPRWAPSPGDRIVAVATELVTGRRIVSPAPSCPDVRSWSGRHRCRHAAHRAALIEVASTVSDALVEELVALRTEPLDQDATADQIKVA